MTITEVLAKINETLEAGYGVAMHKSGSPGWTSNSEYWTPLKWDYWGMGSEKARDTWPVGGRLHVFIVPGTSEGYYLHVEHMGRETSTTLLLGKYLGPLKDGFPVLLAITEMFDGTHPQSCILPD